MMTYAMISTRHEIWPFRLHQHTSLGSVERVGSSLGSSETVGCYGTRIRKRTGNASNCQALMLLMKTTFGVLFSIYEHQHNCSFPTGNIPH
jgi:hypothetical protein